VIVFKALINLIDQGFVFLKPSQVISLFTFDPLLRPSLLGCLHKAGTFDAIG